MEIEVRKLRDGLELLKPVVPKTSKTLPIVTSVLLRNGVLYGTNLEVGVTVCIARSEDEYVLPYSQLVDLLGRVPASDTLTLTQENKTVTLSWSTGKASFTTGRPKDFPPVPEIKEPKFTASLDGDTLIAELANLLPYAATDTSRPVLSGVALVLGEQIALAAADGFRLAATTVPFGLQADGIETLILPPHAIDVLDYLGKKAPRERSKTAATLVETITAKRMLDITCDTGRLCIQFGKLTVFMQLISGKFPEYERLFPKKNLAEVTFMAPEMERAVRSVVGIAKAGSSIIRLVWTDKTMTVSAVNAGEGSIEVSIPAESQTPGRVAINYHYVLEYLKRKASLVTMATSEGPVSFNYFGGGPRVMIMPMYVQWGDEPVKGEAASVPEQSAPSNEGGAAESKTGSVEPATDNNPADIVAEVEDEIESEMGPGEETETARTPKPRKPRKPRNKKDAVAKKA